MWKILKIWSHLDNNVTLFFKNCDNILRYVKNVMCDKQSLITSQKCQLTVKSASVSSENLNIRSYTNNAKESGYVWIKTQIWLLNNFTIVNLMLHPIYKQVLVTVSLLCVPDTLLYRHYITVCNAFDPLKGFHIH